MKMLAVLIIGAFIFFSPQNVWSKEIFTKDKLITVDTNKQLLTAWQDGKIVMQSIASTGLIQSPTVKGSFNIYAKIPLQRMIGISPVHGRYDLPNVPDVMYFYRGYGIHGAYWHNNFGRRMSNGCVNLPLEFADRLYNWADIGTRVEVY